MSITKEQLKKMKAYEILDRFCPLGEPVDGVKCDQDWDNETTILTINGITVKLCGNDVTVE